MVTDHRDIVRAQLRIDEDVRAKPYRDSVGKLTIGVGRNLDDVGLRPDEIALCLENDIAEAEADARVLFPGFDGLSANRRAVLVNMAFNLGRQRLAGFARFRAAVEARNFSVAAAEMLDSRWAEQVGIRARRLAQQMIEG
jgi:lysozyme